jgi:2,4-dienoyl-CoA reductase (NADPH2)
MPKADPEKIAYTPFQIGPLELRNRFIKSATNEGAAPGGVPSKVLLDHHQSMAAGGAALTTIAYCAVKADGRTFEDQIVMNRETLSDLRAITDAVHVEGGAISAQITHGGAFCFLPELSTRYPRSSSGGFNPPGSLVKRYFKKAMTEAEMASTVEDFAAAARLAREAGFDAVEIHMGHGYLLSQFISPAYNKRKDIYGGSPAARALFPAQVLRAVLEAVGDDLAVICKLSTIEGFPGGATIRDTIEVARTLERTGAHMLVLSGGMNIESPWVMFGSPMPPEATSASISNPVLRWMAVRQLQKRQPNKEFESMYFLPYSRKLRQNVKMPLAYLGGVQSRADVGRAMADGFDCVAMGRALIHDPDLVNQFRSGKTSESGCIHCNECVMMMYSPGGTSCVLRGPNDPARNRQPAAS